MKLMRASLVFWGLFLLTVSAAFASEIHVLGGLNREATLEPGERIEGRIVLRNSSQEPQEVRVYQRDYLFYADGRNIYGEPGSVARSNCSWITFTPHQLLVPANDTASVYYAIQAPEDQRQDGEQDEDDGGNKDEHQDAKLVGTYWSMLMVEPVAEGSLQPSAPAEGKAAIGIKTVTRYGIQFVTNVGGSGKREIRFVDTKLLVEGEVRILQLDIENTGERWLRPFVWAELYDNEGMPIGRFGGGRLRIYPGCSARFNIDVSGLPAGNYQALVVADNGDQYVFGQRCTLNIE